VSQAPEAKSTIAIPFAVPRDIGALDQKRLEGTNLPALYEGNKQDFSDIVTILCLDAITDPENGDVNDRHKGFNSFCDLLTQCFLGAPSETMVVAVDEKGRYVNFFGKAILDHVGNQNISIQALYAFDGCEKHTPVWQLAEVFVRHVAIQTLRNCASLPMADIPPARARIKQLQSGQRALEPVPEPQRKTFH
jgi:hypothetical protein